MTQSDKERVEEIRAIMTEKEYQAYDWAINQKYLSVAATYARALAEIVGRLCSERTELMQRNKEELIENARLNIALAKSERRAEAAIADIKNSIAVDLQCDFCGHQDTCTLDNEKKCRLFEWNDPTKEE